MGEDSKEKTEQEKRPETLDEVLAQPLGEDEARRMLADVGVKLAQLRAFRIQKAAELGQLDYQIAAAEFDQAVIYRRTLNAADAGKGE